MKDLSGKRLLLLGGSIWKDAIKQFAEEHRLTLIATGNDMSAGIFEISQEKYNVNLWRDYDEKIIILFCNNACSNSCYWSDITYFVF